MPLPIALAHRIINRITELRQNGTIPWLRPDSKSQVTIEVRGVHPGACRHGGCLDAARPRGLACDPVRGDQVAGHSAGPSGRTDGQHGQVPHQPDGQVRGRRAAWRLGRDRAEDHRRHVWRHGPISARWRAVQRQQDPVPRSIARPPTWPGTKSRRTWLLRVSALAPVLRDSASAYCDRRPRSPSVSTWIRSAHGSDWRRADCTKLIRKIFHAHAVRGSSATYRTPAADLPQDSQWRPFRTLGTRVHLGAHRQGRRLAVGRRCGCRGLKLGTTDLEPCLSRAVGRGSSDPALRPTVGLPSPQTVGRGSPDPPFSRGFVQREASSFFTFRVGGP